MTKISDTDQLIDLLEAAGERGIHTSEIRNHGISGNPSQRIADIEDRGYTIRREWEPYPSDSRRRGRRYWITGRPSAKTGGDQGQHGERPDQGADLTTSPLTLAAPAPRCALFDDWDEAA